MKKILLVLLVSCSPDAIAPDNINPDNPVIVKQYLTIVNNSTVGIYFVKWFDVDNDYNYFGADNVLSGLGNYYNGILSGNIYRREIKTGVSQLYLWFNLSGTDYQVKTSAYITVQAGQDITFTFNNDTLYTEL